MFRNPLDDAAHTLPRTYEGPHIASQDGPTLRPEAVRLPPVQHGVDDNLSVPLDCVVQTISPAIILDRGVASIFYQSNSNILKRAIFYGI